MPGDSIEKNSSRLEFQTTNYSNDVVQKQKLTYEKISQDIFFLFSQCFLYEKFEIEDLKVARVVNLKLVFTD